MLNWWKLLRHDAKPGRYTGEIERGYLTHASRKSGSAVKEKRPTLLQAASLLVAHRSRTGHQRILRRRKLGQVKL
jgi:hypothetical protein